MDFPLRFMDGRLVKSYESFIAYLLRKDDRIQTVNLDFQGKNTVLYMTAAAAKRARLAWDSAHPQVVMFGVSFARDSAHSQVTRFRVRFA